MSKAKIRSTLPDKKKNNKKKNGHQSLNKDTLKNSKILALDPSLNSSGYCLMDTSTGKILALGRIVPDAKDLGTTKIGYIYKELLDIILEHSPGLIVCEDQFIKLNAQTLMKLSHVRGIIMLASNLMGIPLVMYSPAEIKKTICGSGRANKEEVYEKVKIIYKDDPETFLWLKSADLITQGKEKNDDVSDAIAIATSHYKNSSGRLV